MQLTHTHSQTVQNTKSYINSEFYFSPVNTVIEVGNVHVKVKNIVKVSAVHRKLKQEYKTEFYNKAIIFLPKAKLKC